MSPSSISRLKSARARAADHAEAALGSWLALLSCGVCPAGVRPNLARLRAVVLRFGPGVLYTHAESRQVDLVQRRVQRWGMQSKFSFKD